MPAPTFQAAGTGVGDIIAVAPAWPTHDSGDIGLLLIETAPTSAGAATLSTANGFVLVGSASVITASAETTLTVYWCRATSSAMAAPTVADSGDHQFAVILTFRGCIASGDPWDVFATATKTAASTSASAPALTTTVADALVVSAISRNNDESGASFSAWANASLTGVTERYDAGTLAGNGGGIGVATGTRAAAGSVSATTATVTSSTNASMSIALRPPAAATSNAGAFFVMF